jgi:hypothetical protein
LFNTISRRWNNPPPKNVVEVAALSETVSPEKDKNESEQSILPDDLSQSFGK